MANALFAANRPICADMAIGRCIINIHRSLVLSHVLVPLPYTAEVRYIEKIGDKLVRHEDDLLETK